MIYSLTLQTLEDVAALFVVKLTFLQLLLQTEAFIQSLYEDPGWWWRAVASGCGTICEFHFRSAVPGGTFL